MRAGAHPPQTAVAKLLSKYASVYATFAQCEDSIFQDVQVARHECAIDISFNDISMAHRPRASNLGTINQDESSASSPAPHHRVGSPSTLHLSLA